jgi:hypothetical protein
MRMILSVHIAKTAGTAFRDVLSRSYAADQIVFDFDDRIFDPASPFNRDPGLWRRQADDFIQILGSSVRIIHGHFSAVKYREHFADALWITWLRHPVNRLLSQYFHWRHRPPPSGSAHSLRQFVWDSQMPFGDYAQIPLMQNPITRLYLRGLTLKEIYFVGLQERFAEDLRALQTRLGWPLVEPIAVNINRHPTYQDEVAAIQRDRALIRLVEDLNRDDLDLYDTVFCQRPFEASVSATK